MNDTTPEIAQKVCEMIREKSPVERFKMGCSMYETSRYLITRAILENHPQISPADLRQEIFLKFYGNDFAPAERKKILEHLGKITSSNFLS